MVVCGYIALIIAYCVWSRLKMYFEDIELAQFFYYKGETVYMKISPNQASLWCPHYGLLATKFEFKPDSVVSIEESEKEGVLEEVEKDMRERISLLIRHTENLDRMSKATNDKTMKGIIGGLKRGDLNEIGFLTTLLQKIEN